MSIIRRINLAVALSCLVVLVGCGDEGGGSDAPVALQGQGQKGPFEPAGADATAYELAEDGQDSGESTSAAIEEGGAFSFGEFGWSGPTRVVVEGTFYDEIDGEYGGESRSLQMIIEVGEDEVSGNVNFFTHLHAARTIHLMGEGTPYDEASTRAIDDVEWISDVETDARELDIFKGLDETEGDDRRLLEFSVALLTTEMTQEEIDTIAADFAEDGELDDDGEPLFEELEDAIDAAGFGQTADAAAGNLRGDFPGQLPDDEQDDDDSVDLEPDCPSGASVVCPDDVGEDTIPPNESEDWEIYATFPGSYVVAVIFDESSRFNGWTLYQNSDFSGQVGSQIEGSVVEAPTQVPLEGETTYYLRVDNGASDPNPVSVSTTRVSDGRANEPIEIRVDQRFEGTAGDNNQIKNFTSYYAFKTNSAGVHTVTLGEYACGGSSQGLRAELIEAESAEDAFSGDLTGGTSLDLGSSDGACELELEANLQAATTYYLEVTNMNNRSLSGTSGESYSIMITER